MALEEQIPERPTFDRGCLCPTSLLLGLMSRGHLPRETLERESNWT